MTIALRGAGSVRSASALIKTVVVAAFVLCVCAALTCVRAGASEAKPFGISKFTMQTIENAHVVVNQPMIASRKFRLENVPYSPAFTQAGGRPWGLATTVNFTTEELAEKVDEHSEEKATAPTRDPKDIVVDLPPGLLGDPNPEVFPRCPLPVILPNLVRCPSDTQVGVFRVRWFDGAKESLAPIVNVTPEAGQSAEFGLETSAKVTALLAAHVVRSGATYGLAIVSNEIPIVGLVEAETTFWGVPADPSHDSMRGLVCEGKVGLEICRRVNNTKVLSEAEVVNGGVSSGVTPEVFLTMPTDCAAGPETTSVRADSWEEPGQYSPGPAAMWPGVTGCDLLKFEPGIEVKPDTLLADAPVGLDVNLQVAQSQGAVATPQLRNAVVTLPEGLSISPGDRGRHPGL